MTPLTPDAPPPGRVLVAGIGNIFLGDDGFGVEAVRELAARPLSDRTETADIGVRGVHLAYRLLDDYDTVILVDTVERGSAPGTLHVIEPEDTGTPAPPDGHRMTPDAVLALLGTLCASTGARPPLRTLVVGCEPAVLDEGIGLSPPVTDAVPRAVRLIEELLAAPPPQPAPRPLAGRAVSRGDTE